MNSTKFLDKQDLKFYPTRVQQPRSTLEQGVYQIIIPQMGAPHYLNVGELTMPDEVYGDVNEQVDRILQTFNNSKRNLGVFFAGLKGTGKTLTARILALKTGLPVIRCQHALSEAELSFIQDNFDLTGPCVIFLDEFDKLYNLNESGQSKCSDPTVMSRLLSFMDGAGSSKFMFILTSNNLNMPEFLTNRMGRVRYVQGFDGLNPKIIDQYIEDKLENKELKDSVYQFVARFPNITFDILVNLIAEMNMYNEPAQKAIKMLNVRTEDAYYMGDITLYGVKLGTLSATIEPGDFVEKMVDSDDDELNVNLAINYDLGRKLTAMCATAGVEYNDVLRKITELRYSSNDNEKEKQEAVQSLRDLMYNQISGRLGDLDKAVDGGRAVAAFLAVLHDKGKLPEEPVNLMSRFQNNQYNMVLEPDEWTRGLEKRGKKLFAKGSHNECNQFCFEISPSRGRNHKFAF